MKGNVDLQLPDFPSSLLSRIDRYAQLLEEVNPGVKFTRTACVTSLLSRALAEIEGQSAWGRRRVDERRQGLRGGERRKDARRWRDNLMEDAEKEVLNSLRDAAHL
jgi:hypothetical protein